MHKVISLKQPWATLVVMGAKKYETRSWATKYRGELLIHSSAKLPALGFELAYEFPFNKYLDPGKDLLTGLILGSVNLVDVFPVEDLTGEWTPGYEVPKLSKEERAFGDYSSRRFAWILENPVRFKEPIRASGALGIWDFHAHLQLQPHLSQ